MSRDKLLSSGQVGTVHSDIIGIFLFASTDADVRTDEPWTDTLRDSVTSDERATTATLKSRSTSILVA